MTGEHGRARVDYNWDIDIMVRKVMIQPFSLLKPSGPAQRGSGISFWVPSVSNHEHLWSRETDKKASRVR